MYYNLFKLAEIINYIIFKKKFSTLLNTTLKTECNDVEVLNLYSVPTFMELGLYTVYI